MRWHTRFVTSLAVLGILVTFVPAFAASEHSAQPASVPAAKATDSPVIQPPPSPEPPAPHPPKPPQPSQAPSSPALDDLRALGGEWIFFEDRTEGRTLEQLAPPMSSTFALRIEEGAIVLVFGHGGIGRDVRVALDGSHTEVTNKATGEVARCRAEWKDGTLTYEIDFVRKPGGEPEGLIKREFRMTPDGLLVRASRPASVGVYRHAEDIPLPTPAKAVIGDLAWLAGAWVGTRGSQGQISFEERWGPPLGGAMLATSRTVSRDKMTAFEFLRIVERDGGLVYVAQPNGGTATEFVLTELTVENGSGTGSGTGSSNGPGNGPGKSTRRAVFDNPRHDYPRRIVYEWSDEVEGGAGSGLSATIGYIKGGTPRRFEFKREASGK